MTETAYPSRAPVVQRPNHHERISKTKAKRRCRAARVVVTPLADPVQPMRRQAAIGRIAMRAIRRWGPRTSAPELGELLCKGHALVVAGLSGGRTPRQIHHVDTERID